MVEKFECKMCDFAEEYPNEDSPIACPDCGSKFYRLRFLKESGVKSNSRWGANHPRWSWAMGINVDKIPEMMRRYPDRNYHPKTGQLEIKNRPHKKRMMKEHGMEEYG